MNMNSVKPISIVDDWFITQSFIFPRDTLTSINLSEELINCVRFEEEEYSKLLHTYHLTVDLLNQREKDMSERLTTLNDLYTKVTKINQIDLLKDLLNSSMWSNLYKLTTNLENLCSKPSQQV
ncbi:unnamed protein product [Adineta ricciae]|uniref:Uncharacterized protein n=1 Tax=Adineta ricciae TaxID=249248 RepID=A0A814CNJ7_ADIRI|nr:unnamed protein product [Adineta ricciae]